MLRIEIFTDYVKHRKSLKEYIAIRKMIHEQGEFDDASLIKAEENLLRLQREEPDVYDGMYATLEELYERNIGLTIEYPIEFIRQILKMYCNTLTPVQIYEEYKRVLDHYHHHV